MRLQLFLLCFQIFLKVKLVRKGDNMRFASTFNLGHVILFLLIQFSCNSSAQEWWVNSLPSLAEKKIMSVESQQVNTTTTSLNVFKSWQEPALENSILSRPEIDNSQPIEALFVIDKMKHLQQQIDLRFQTGLYSLKNNYVLSSHHSALAFNQFMVPNLAQHDLYQFGRFSTETGYSNPQNTNEQGYKAFLHSAYSVINRGRFDLSVTASIESIDSTANISSLKPQLEVRGYLANNELSTSATLGVIGSFDLSNRWSLIGALTTSHLTSDKNSSLIPDENRQKMALIGTTYSF
jgi:hypothetical protein